MYLSLVNRWFTRVRLQIRRAVVMRSGLLTLFILAMIFLVSAFAWKAHQRGRFAQFQVELKRPASPPTPVVLRPGGQEPIILERTQVGEGSNPEFLKATLLPGRGMNVQQITAYIPGKGEVQLLASPPLDKAAALLTGAGDDLNGAASLIAGSAYEAPWAGRLYGNVSADGKTLTITWDGGHALSLPLSGRSGILATAAGGLLVKRQATLANTNVMPDGGEAKATFDAGDFDGHWLSKTQITTTVQLNSRAIEMRIIARNTGSQPEPMGLGWQPRFVILSNDRAAIRLRLPSDVRTETNRRSGLPTGKLLSSSGGEYDFTSRDGTPLGTLSLDDIFVHLRQAPLENGPIMEIRDTENNYGLRITTLSSPIKAVHVYAPADQKFISIAPQFNYDDPFGHQWPASEDTGMVTLAPGQSVEWRIRLEIFSPNAPPAIAS